MKLLTELLATPEGLLSFIVIVFMLGMLGFFVRLFLSKTNAPGKD